MNQQLMSIAFLLRDIRHLTKPKITCVMTIRSVYSEQPFHPCKVLHIFIKIYNRIYERVRKVSGSIENKTDEDR